MKCVWRSAEAEWLMRGKPLSATTALSQFRGNLNETKYEPLPAKFSCFKKDFFDSWLGRLHARYFYFFFAQNTFGV